VDKIMESLVAQPGAPILTFGEPAGGKVSVAQQRFFLSPSIQPNPAQKWSLPVCIKTGSERQECEVLNPADSTIKVPSASLFFANAGGKGYYRSAYPPSLYAGLVANVETDLNPAERISLIGDEWARVRANRATVGDYLNLVSAVKTDPNGDVVANALSGVNAIYQRVAATPEERAALSAWIRFSFAPQLAKLRGPAQSDSTSTRKLRSKLFGVLGYYGQDPAVLAQARQIAEKYLADPASADPTLSQTALFIAARNGDAALFDRLKKLHETTTNPELQETTLFLLAEFQNPALVQRSLDYAVSGKVRNQDAAGLIAGALQAEETRDQAWKYIQANWDKVQAQFTTATGSWVVGATGSFCSADARDEVKNFFSTHKVAATGVAFQHALEHIDGCIELRSLQEPNLKQWIATQPKP
jgi:aminopeptidase N/puromycin-sensitive aminopeptidase